MVSSCAHAFRAGSIGQRRAQPRDGPSLPRLFRHSREGGSPGTRRRTRAPAHGAGAWRGLSCRVLRQAQDRLRRGSLRPPLSDAVITVPLLRVHRAGVRRGGRSFYLGHFGTFWDIPLLRLAPCRGRPTDAVRRGGAPSPTSVRGQGATAKGAGVSNLTGMDRMGAALIRQYPPRKAGRNLCVQHRIDAQFRGGALCPPHEEEGGGSRHRAWPWIATPRSLQSGSSLTGGRVRGRRRTR